MKDICKFKISVLIITYNNASTIAQCLESLKGQTFNDYEILIRDNASVDRTVELIEKYQDIKIFKSEQNTGFGAAINYLASRAGGDFLFILNPDCICPANTLFALNEFGQAHEGAISPALAYPDNSLQVSARNFPDHKNILFSRRSPLFQLGLVKTRDAGYIVPDQPSKVPAISATAMFIRRSLFEQVGGFDERFFMYLEDIDLCRRLSDNKIDVWYLPDIKLTHVLGASSSTAAIRTLVHHHLSIYKYFTKHFPKKYTKNLLLAILLMTGLVVTVILTVLGLKRRK